MTARSARENWKRAEREIAALLGGVRVPITGRIRGSAPDIEHPEFSLEIKRRESLPAWLFEDAFEQADMSNDGTKTPIVIVEWARGKGRARERYCVLRLNDLIELLERGQE